MSNNSFSDAVRQALAKKHEQHHPQAKKGKQQRQKNSAAPMVKASPIRKASSRGG